MDGWQDCGQGYGTRRHHRRPRRRGVPLTAHSEAEI